MLKQLGIKDRPGIDINAACSGFVYGLSLANSLIKTKEYKNIAIIGVEKFSKFLDWTDRGTCILFGDGAGAGIVSMNNGDGSEIIASYLGGDSIKGDVLSCDAGLSQQLSKENINRKEDHFLLMDGQEVFKFAAKAVPLAINGVLERADMSIEQIKLIVPHQANIRIIETVAKNLKIPIDKFYINIQKYGNTSSATVPIAFSEAIEEKKIKRGDFILTVGLVLV
jgi:3-oxoacyl-[acyl-carrier-protein] synthase-3